MIISNRELEKLTTREKIDYFENLKDFCTNENFKKARSKNVFHEMITKIYPNFRNYDYTIIGSENIPSDGRGIFVCNHSNSHDFFTSHEVFKKLGTNVSVFAASDDLGVATNLFFKSCDAVLIDRDDKDSIERGMFQFSSNLIGGVPGIIFGEGTWNLHPYRPMQQIKIGSSNIAAITDLPIIPTIFEYVENPKICSKENELYCNCIVMFGKPINISRDESLITQTNAIQAIMEQARLNLWKELGIEKFCLEDVEKGIYLNHTYLKKFDALGFTYDSLSESKYLFSKDKQPVENEFYINEQGEFVPGITSKMDGKKYVKLK